MSEPRKFLLIGGASQSQPIRELLQPLRLGVERFGSLEEAASAETVGKAAVVLVPPLAAPCESVVGAARARFAELPLFVVAREELPDAQVVRLYRRGATAVFAWELERRILPSVLAELLGVETRPAPRTDADRSLERAIRARLRVLGKAERGLRIAARNGVVRLSGRVDALWRLRWLDHHVAHVPGVRATDARRLEVEPSGLADRVVARSVRALLGGVSSIEDRTLSVSVHDGHVVLTGAVVNREEWLHALELLAMLRGVRSVTNTTTEAPRRKRDDRGLAVRLQERLHTLVAGSRRIRVAVLGGVAVLRGRAPLLVTRREAEALVARDGAVARVVNKVEIEAEAPPDCR